MKPATFRYARPTTLEEVVAALVAGDEGRLIAGGQSLLPLLNMRVVRPAVLIDVALVPELHVLAREGDELVVGAGVRQRTAETSTLVRDACPLLPFALRHVGFVATRSRGTIGGSLAHADPAAQLSGVALALDAVLVAVGPRGRRTIAAHDFFYGPHATALGRDEVLTEMRLPIRPAARHAFLEVARRSGGAAAAGIAAAVQLDDNGRVVEAALAAVGVADTPLRLTMAEQAARGGARGPAVAAAAVEDVGGASYRSRVVGALVSRALDRMAA
jgi:carbon-monoxide dehydrogenase medium subunit